VLEWIEMEYLEILEKLKSMADLRAVEGMARFGINPKNTYGVSIPNLRKIAKQAGTDHALAQQLWNSGVHEARILACMIDAPELITEKQIEKWVGEFDSWDICDQCCSNLFDKTRFAYEKAVEWSQRKREFVMRAGFVMMAVLAVHDKSTADGKFLKFLPIIKRESTDNRNFVKKAVNWSLRQIGKRNINLNRAAIETAKEIQRLDNKAAKWIAADALRELASKAVQEKIRRFENLGTRKA